ncbi:hypothetical protein [Devosia sp. Leaf420]|uniref:hypothetical protein n=1 Tax=Devosia sp. Leaf420 TaxID=1736374 RepID=UPI000A96C7DC|nr:hypothetical protein [Devosia sp. Leaf420]
MVGLMRFAVPAAGLVILAILLIQIAISSFGARYGIGTITIDQDRVRVEAPEYAGTMSDGSTYRVWAEQAEAKIENTDLIELANARVEVNRNDGLRREASASRGVLDTIHQQVVIEGATDIGDSSGTSGRLVDSVFDWLSQTLTTQGAVSIDYADGTTIRAKGMVHEAELGRWTFNNAIVTLPSTPGENH